MAETLLEEAPVKEKKESLFSKKNVKLLKDPLDDDNPITIQVLGVCSALAVTTQLKPSFVMTIAVVAVCAISNVTISLIRAYMPSRIRMIIQLVVIAALVILVNEILKAFQYDVYKQLSVYIGLIITNCIIMGRLEAFAMANKPWPALLDGIGNGVGYGAILLIVAFFREIFGSGKFFGIELFNAANYSWYEHNGIMLMPSAAMFLIGVVIWVQRSRKSHLVDAS
jgi:Na+-transporting NADH:ubiquinone oxidoreductase subunit D